MAAKVSIRPNGPYLVEGEVELVDVNGNKIDTSGRGPRFALCRCGGSVTKRSVTVRTVRLASRLQKQPSPRKKVALVGHRRPRGIRLGDASGRLGPAFGRCHPVLALGLMASRLPYFIAG
jgi:hypothetical protein